MNLLESRDNRHPMGTYTVERLFRDEVHFFFQEICLRMQKGQHLAGKVFSQIFPPEIAPQCRGAEEDEK